MPFLVKPLVTVDDGPTFIVTNSFLEAQLAADVFALQWRYVHFNADAEELLPYRGVQIAGHTVETQPGVLDEYARRGDFDLAEIYRGSFS